MDTLGHPWLIHLSYNSPFFPLLEPYGHLCHTSQYMASDQCRPSSQAFWGFSSPVAHPLLLFFSLVLQEVSYNCFASLCCHESPYIFWHGFCPLSVLLRYDSLAMNKIRR